LSEKIHFDVKAVSDWEDTQVSVFFYILRHGTGKKEAEFDSPRI
jgi:hypothetical protein